jgi:uncharacterized protein (TIGR02466 family)
MKLSNNQEPLAIFPTPVVRFKTPDTLMRHVSSLKHITNSNPHQISSHYISDNKYVLNLPQYEDLKQWITARTTEFVRDVLNVESDALITQSWVNRNSPGEFTHLHPHPNSIVSGVFYMDVPDGNALIMFHKQEAGGTGYFILEPGKYNKDTNRDHTYSSRTYKLNVTAGDLVLFPSWLLHSVPTNTTKFERWCMAFNSMIPFSIGMTNSLNEFKYPLA